MIQTKWFRLCCAMLALAAVSATPVEATNITNVVEINGDPTGGTYIPTQWTGQTFTVTTAGVPYLANAVGDSVTVPNFVVTGTPASPPVSPAAYTDRHHSWADGGNFFGIIYPTLPSYLVGGELITPPQNLRDNATLQLDVTVANPSTVYLLIDNRLGEAPNSGDNGNVLDPPTFGPNHMAWVAANGWLPVATGNNHQLDSLFPDEVTMDENQDAATSGNPAFGNIDNIFSVYAKVVPAGTFSLYQANKDAGNLNMYGVVITSVPEPATVMLMLIGTAAACTVRPRKRSV